MVRRLVLGHGPVGGDVIEQLAASHGDLFVITDDAGWVTTLRDTNITAVEADPTDTATYPSDIDLVVVTDDTPDTVIAAAESARAAFPDAFITGVHTPGMTNQQRQQLNSIVDQSIDFTEILSKLVLDAASGVGGQITVSLSAMLRSIDGPLGVFAHDNPDPDAIASALAFAELASKMGVDGQAYYFGEISHQENRALVNLLEIPITQCDPNTFDPNAYGSIALVDHSQPGINNSLPEETPVDFVIDHHPPRVPIDRDGRFVDIRPDVGSTSTLLAEYYQRLGFKPTEQIATALVYGIRTDTKDFTREVSQADFEAAAFLYPSTDESALGRVETPSVGPEVLRTTAKAIRNREVRGTALTTCVGEIKDRDTLSQASDLLLTMAGIETTVVYGFMNGVVYVSGRARGSKIDLGETFREAFDQIGSAGGHTDMAGGQLPLGILEDVSEPSKQELETVVRDIVAGRFFETLDSAPQTPVYDADELAAFPED
ncbi:DHH family phosphoesterase [Natronocalculus amylovorans]|uniref:DHH family phosphoesterase n=1 Tax=Natronocalculus amylovorans TaxID=2917812 RepID=A0AAE3FYW4_9EURY|nr:DHH family phosphoesterase [Natronocalculus amylovorans]MCL9817593.1 DHH family phosphoesterase [Natronocalculus amylovorans]